VLTCGPVSLYGRRVRLEPLTRDHALELYDAGRAPEVWRYLSQGPFLTHADAVRWIDDALAQQETGERRVFAVVSVETGRVIGSTSYFFELRWSNRSVEIAVTWLRGTDAPNIW